MLFIRKKHQNTIGRSRNDLFLSFRYIEISNWLKTIWLNTYNFMFLPKKIPLLPSYSMSSNCYINTDFSSPLSNCSEKIQITSCLTTVYVKLYKTTTDLYLSKFCLPLSSIMSNGLINSLDILLKKNDDTLSSMDKDLLTHAIYFFRSQFSN